MQEFIDLFRIEPEDVYDLDDEFFKKVSDEDDVDTLENRVHKVLKSNSKDYSIFRQFAINAASTDPTSFGAFGESVKTAHEAAVALLGPLYNLKQAPSSPADVRNRDGSPSRTPPRPPGEINMPNTGASTPSSLTAKTRRSATKQAG
jgi:hypothetical protein